jgi:hypothetical protein
VRVTLRFSRRARLGIRRYIGLGPERQIVVRLVYVRVVIDRG